MASASRTLGLVMAWTTVVMLPMRDRVWEQELHHVLLLSLGVEREPAFRQTGSVMALLTVLEVKTRKDVTTSPPTETIHGILLDITLLLENMKLGDEDTTTE